MGTDQIAEKNTPNLVPEHSQKPVKIDTVHPHTKKPLIDDERKTVHEIRIIKEELKNLPEPETEKPEISKTPEPQLFPPQKSLFEQHHQEYKQEIKTPMGLLNRLVDIRQLKKYGIPEAKKFYDSMRSIGFSSFNIGQFVGDSNSGNYDFFSKKDSFKDLPKTLERLNSLGIDPKKDSGFMYDFSKVTPDWFYITTSFSRISDERFQEIKNQLQPYPFLKETIRIDAFSIFRNEFNLSESSKKTLDVVKEIYELTPPLSYKSKYHSQEEKIEFNTQFFLNILKDKFPVDQSKENYFINFYESYNNYSEKDSPITVPLSIRDIVKSETSEVLLNLNKFKNTKYQKFYLSTDVHDQENIFDKNGNPNSIFFVKFYDCYKNKNPEITLPDNYQDFSDKEKAFWNKLISADSDTKENLLEFGVNIDFDLFDKQELKNISYFQERNIDCFNNDNYFTIDGIPTLGFYGLDVIGLEEPNEKIITLFSEEEKQKLNKILSFKDVSFRKFLFKNHDSIDELIDQNGQPTSKFFEKFINESKFWGINKIDNLLIPETLKLFSKEDQNFWSIYKNIRESRFRDFAEPFLTKNKNNNKLFFDKDNNPTKLFFEELSNSSIPDYNRFFYSSANKSDWQFIFGQKNIDDLLNSLPVSTHEKRNAFTHNEYDRTSKFFEFLTTNNQINFKLNNEDIKLVTEYIENFGLAKSQIIFEYFTNIKKIENGTIKSLPAEYIENGIVSMENLKDQVNEFKKKCFSQESIINPQELNQFKQGLLSIVTGHATNRWTRTPLDRIIGDFSTDLANGEIAPLDSHFKSTSSEISKIKTEIKEDLTQNTVFQNLKQEIITAIDESDKIDDHKSKITDILTNKISILSSKESNDFIKKQIDSFTSHLELINQSNSIDSLTENMLTLNLNLGSDKNRDYQQEFNSVLRQLVFQKTFIKHQSPEWRENLKNNLANNNDVLAINDSLNFLNNFIKDHTLNFGTNNEEKYWNKKTFETMKKYSKVFKNNLSIGLYTQELLEIKKSFETTKEDSSLNIEMIPDRGLIGEMSGYMADVCYTKVYPLLKQYPNLTPYKFIDQSSPDNPEFIGSVLVFKVDSAEDEPVFLVRAFDVPNEQEIDVGIFFEKFIDSLSQTAQELGVKKIIAAGTSGSISNYSSTTNYVLLNYVTGKTNTPLKEKFDFNGYDITNQCYLIRDLK